MAEPDVPEVCEGDELAVLLLLTLPTALLTVRAASQWSHHTSHQTINFKNLSNLN